METIADIIAGPTRLFAGLRESAQLAAGMTIVGMVFLLVQALLLMEGIWWWP